MSKMLEFIRSHKRAGTPTLALLCMLSIAAVAYSYLGPDRTVTESHVETFDYGVWARDEDYAGECAPYHGAGHDCIICSWERDPGRGCGDATYWYTLGSRSEVVTNTTHLPPATVSGAAACTSPGSGGWCAGGGSLRIDGAEPLTDQHILAIEGAQNGVNFACANAVTCTVPLLEGTNDFGYWAVSSWGDTSSMGTSSLKQDSQAPQISGSPSGVPGENGWYVSTVDVTAAAIDPVPGSGLSAFVYSLDGSAPAGYSLTITILDGIHDLIFTATDGAGNASGVSQSISVDTVAPQPSASLSGNNGGNGWYISSVTYTATAADASPGSGVERIEVAVDDGGWTTYTSPLALADGSHSLQLRAFDAAGNTADGATLSYKQDTRGPKIDLPDSWNVWDTAGYSVRDGMSNLSSVEVIISDAEGRWPKVTQLYHPDGGHYDGQIVWDRRFADGTLAPVGNYDVTVKATDRAENFSSERATIHIPGFPALPVVVAAPASIEEEAETVIIATPAPEMAAVAPAIPAPRSAVTSQFSSPPPLPQPAAPASAGLLFGAAATAAMSGIMAYALEQQRKREEEEARQAAEAAAKAAKLNAAEEARKIQNWQEGHALLEETLAHALSLGASKQELDAIRAQAAQEGIGAVTARADAAVQAGFDRLSNPPALPPMPEGLSPEAQAAYLHGGAAAANWIASNAGELQAQYAAHQQTVQAQDAPEGISPEAQAAFLHSGAAALWVEKNQEQLREEYAQQQHPGYFGQVSLNWPAALRSVDQFHQYQLNVPNTGPVECVTTAVVTAMNMMKDLLADRFDRKPLPDVLVQDYVTGMDQMGIWEMPYRVPSDFPTIPIINLPIAGWMHPAWQAPRALERFSNELDREYGCGFTVQQTSGNDLDDIARNLQQGNLVLVHGLWEVTDPKNPQYQLGGGPHTMGTVVGLDGDAQTVTILDPGVPTSTHIMPRQEFEAWWGRPSTLNLYTAPNTMTLLIPDTVCSPVNAQAPTPTASPTSTPPAAMPTPNATPTGSSLTPPPTLPATSTPTPTHPPTTIPTPDP